MAQQQTNAMIGVSGRWWRFPGAQIETNSWEVEWRRDGKRYLRDDTGSVVEGTELSDAEIEQLSREMLLADILEVRSNLQNPIKKWNLISNDDYQHSLARYFRKNKLYYERRDGEWAQRRTELKSVGIHRGPQIKELMQLIASYHWDKKYLGPVAAKGGRGGLFEEKPYEAIRKTPPELVYQIYLLSEAIDRSLKELAASKRYVEELATYLRLALFSICVKALQASGAEFGQTELTATLENGSMPEYRLRRFCKSGIDIIRAAYKAEGKRYRQKMGKELTLANFSKAQEYVGKLLQKPLPQSFRQLGRQVVAGLEA